MMTIAGVLIPDEINVLEQESDDRRYKLTAVAKDGCKLGVFLPASVSAAMVRESVACFLYRIAGRGRRNARQHRMDDKADRLDVGPRSGS